MIQMYNGGKLVRNLGLVDGFESQVLIALKIICAFLLIIVVLFFLLARELYDKVYVVNKYSLIFIFLVRYS